MKGKKPIRWWHGYPFWDGLGLGLFLGVFFTLLVFWIAGGRPELISKNIVSFFAIIASLAAALISLQGVRSRMNHDIEMKQQEKANLLIAAKAELASALSILSSIAQQQVEFTITFPHPSIRPQLDPRPRTFDAIKECINLADPQSQKWLALIMMRFQVVVARSQAPLNGTIATSGAQTFDGRNLISSALEWAEYKAIVENAFEFARGEQQFISSFDSQRISSPFFNLQILTNSTPYFKEELTGRIERRKNATPSDWFG